MTPALKVLPQLIQSVAISPMKFIVQVYRINHQTLSRKEADVEEGATEACGGLNDQLTQNQQCVLDLTDQSMFNYWL